MLRLLPERHLRRQSLHAVPERLSRAPYRRGKGIMMGPADYGRVVPLSDAGGSQDNVRDMEALVASHPTLTWIRPPSPGAPHVATWDEDTGSKRVERRELGDLVQLVRTRLRR